LNARGLRPASKKAAAYHIEYKRADLSSFPKTHANQFNYTQTKPNINLHSSENTANNVM